MTLLQRFSVKIILFLFAIITFVSCDDDDSFSSDYGNVLSFVGSDTLSLDTVFSTVPSPHKEKMIHNASGDGIRISSIRQCAAAQSGFRVNVNGSYLNESSRYMVNDMELRNGDSLRIFVEMTTKQGKDVVPRLVKDSLIFTLESGRQQILHLNAWTWDARVLRNYKLTDNETLSNENGMPIVVFDSIRVDSTYTLTIAPGTTIYFHSNAGIDVFGSLKIDGEKDKEVTLRSDRLDRMVSNLMYDNNPGQWGGILLRPSSYDNTVKYCDIHAGTTAFLCESDSTADTAKVKLNISHSTLHNLRQSGIVATNAKIILDNTQVSNAFTNCLNFLGGRVKMDYCTIAQYYPFDANRGAALYFANAVDTINFPLTMNVRNSIIKGYEDDVITWYKGPNNNAIDARFTDCLLRTALPPDEDSLMFKGSIYEDVTDTISDPEHSFVLFDTDYFFYDFTPKEGSQAIGAAKPLAGYPDDRKGNTRSTTTPDIGCYETDKAATEK